MTVAGLTKSFNIYVELHSLASCDNYYVLITLSSVISCILIYRCPSRSNYNIHTLIIRLAMVIVILCDSSWQYCGQNYFDGIILYYYYI